MGSALLRRSSTEVGRPDETARSDGAALPSLPDALPEGGRVGTESRFIRLTPLGYRPVSEGPTPDEDRLPADALAAIDEARTRLASVPAEIVVANHAMGLYELAAIHLSSEPARLEEARLAVDALGALVEALGTRLGEHSETLEAALAQIRLAWVAVSER